MIGELAGFFKRNGLRNIVCHTLEVYPAMLLRYLPGIEGLFLRALFYKVFLRSCGKNLIIYPNVYIIFSHKISVGNRVAFNTGSYLDGRGEMQMGDNVLIGPNCVLSTVEHSLDSTKIPMALQSVKYGKIVIGNDVWIGANSFIKRGVTIHDGAVISAGSVVTTDIPPYSLYGGNPPTIIPRRDIHT